MNRIATPRRPQENKPAQKQLVIPGPNELNVPPDNLLEYTICIYGTKGIGKTTLTSSIPGGLVVMTEPLRKNLKIRQVSLSVNDVDAINEGAADAWVQFKSIIQQSQNPESGVKCLIIDTVDRLYDACLNHHCVVEGVRHPGGLNDFGKLWSVIKDDFETTLNRIREVGLGLVLISHTKESDIEVVTGGKVTQYGPSCSGAALRYIKAAADYAFFFGWFDRKRCIHLRGYENIWTACGVPERFISPSGNPLELIEIPEGETKGWTILQKAFDNKVYDALEEVPSQEAPKPSRKRS